MALTVTHACSTGVSRVGVAGELDMATVPELNRVIDGLLDDGQQRILIDLATVSFCDSAGLAAFVRGDQLAAAAGGWLRLTGATGAVSRVLRVSGLDQILCYGQDADDPTVVSDH